MKNDLVYINHILDSIKAIEDFSSGLTKVQFQESRLFQNAIIREIEILGEAVKNISIKTKQKFVNVEWKEIAGTRDILVHHYFGVDISIIWNIVKKDIPILKKEMQLIKRELENNLNK